MVELPRWAHSSQHKSRGGRRRDEFAIAEKIPCFLGTAYSLSNLCPSYQLSVSILGNRMDLHRSCPVSILQVASLDAQAYPQANGLSKSKLKGALSQLLLLNQIFGALRYLFQTCFKLLESTPYLSA